ncbi:MAG TPA: hypothetical protein VGG69_05285 [Rhizomicrobium sp.]
MLHGLKTLVRKHPGAALHVAGATVAYAGREVLHEGTGFVEKKIEEVSHVFDRQNRAQDGVPKPECRALAEKLSMEERRALARLAVREHK